MSALLLTSGLASSANIELELTTHVGEQRFFNQGDRLHFLLNINQDAFLYIYYLDAKKQLHKLIPTQSLSPLFVHSGWFIPVPGQDFELVVSPPFGKEKIFVLALSGMITDTQDREFESEEKLIDFYREAALSNQLDFGVVSKEIVTQR